MKAINRGSKIQEAQNGGIAQNAQCACNYDTEPRCLATSLLLIEKQAVGFHLFCKQYGIALARIKFRQIGYRALYRCSHFEPIRRVVHP